MPEDKPKYRKTYYSSNVPSTGNSNPNSNFISDSEVETTVNVKLNTNVGFDSDVSSNISPTIASSTVSANRSKENDNQSSSDSFSSESGVSQNEGVSPEGLSTEKQNSSNNNNKTSGPGVEAPSSSIPNQENSASVDSNDTQKPESKNPENIDNRNDGSAKEEQIDAAVKNPNPKKSGGDSSVVAPIAPVPPADTPMNNESNPSAPSGQNGFRKNSNFQRRGQLNQPQAEEPKNFKKNDNTESKNKLGLGQGKSDGSNSKLNPLANKSKKDNNKEAIDSSSQGAETLGKIAKLLKKIGAFIIAHIHLILPLLLVVILVFFIIVIMSAIMDDGSDSGSSNNGNISGPISRGGESSSRKCSEMSSSPISVKATKLSRDEFIEKVTSYETQSQPYKKYFVPNAGVIYDVATRKGINPELVVIRAFNEGFAPMATRSAASSSYNFWGIGCYNGTSKFSSYNNFEAAVEGFCDTLLKYQTDNIYEVMKKYAYIGDNWYYPGSSGDGGCYYKSYVMPFLTLISEPRSKEVEATCRDHTQIKTNADDQLAYTQYQVDKNLLSVRKRIFGLDSDNVSVCRSYKVTFNLLTPDETRKVPKMTQNSSGTVRQLLTSNGSSIDKFNTGLLSSVNEAGAGTREGVVTAAIYVINTFNAYKYRLPYSFSGGHGASYNNAAGDQHDKVSSSYYGINPYIGEDIYTGSTRGYTNTRNGQTKIYYNLGLDCSGFVTWALKNGGIDKPISNAVDFKNDANATAYPIKDISTYTGRPGDVVASDTHVGLILKYDADNRRYLVAEESDGLVNTYYNIDTRDKYKVVDMSYYYNNKKTINYTEQFVKGIYR